MSLILDALKRAERERRLGQAPDALEEVPTPPPAPPGNPGRSQWLLAGAAVAVVGLALFAWWRSGSDEAADPVADRAASETPAGEPTPAFPPAPDAVAAATGTDRVFDEASTPPDPVVSAQIEDDGEIATLDDLTGDGSELEFEDSRESMGLSDDDPAAAASSLDAQQEAQVAPAVEPATELAQVAPGPTLYTPSRPPVPLPAAPAPAPVRPAAPLPAPAAPAPTPAPKPVVAAAAAAPAKAIPKPATAAKPAVTPPPPAPIMRPAPPAPAASSIVLEPAPPRVYAQPPGPIVRFGADGRAEVIPVESPTPTPAPSQLPAAVEPATESATAPASAPAPAPAAAVPAIATSVETSPAPAPTVETAAAVPPPAPLPAPAPAPAIVEAAPAPFVAPAPAPAPVARRTPTPAPMPSAASGLRRLRDMPANYRAEFPPLSVDVHVYNADPARRFVLVNGKRYVEGTALAEGPRIVEIVSDGMVVEWRSERIVYAIGR